MPSAYTDGAVIPASNTLIAPRAEVEIAFRLKQTLSGTDNSEARVLEATGLYFTLPLKSSTPESQTGKISIQDTISDNASCGVFVLGEAEIDPPGSGSVSIKNRPIQKRLAAQYWGRQCRSGQPLVGSDMASQHAGRRTVSISRAGEIILSGSVVPLEPVQSGDTLRLEMSGSDISTCGASCSFS